MINLGEGRYGASVYLEERPAPGLALLLWDGDRMIWHRAKLRKPTTCAVSRRELEPGEEAYRPAGNTSYRMMRIAPEVIEQED